MALVFALIMYHNIRLNNMMYRIKDSEIYGFLNDYDLVGAVRVKLSITLMQ